MFRVLSRQMEAFRPRMRAQLPERVLRDLRAEGFTAEIDNATGDIVATDARGEATRIALYKDGLPATLTLPSLAQLKFEYDAEGRLASVVHPGDQRLEISRDQRDNISEIRRPSLFTYRFGFDDDDRLLSITYPDRTTFRLSYHATGLVERVTDRTGASTVFKRDASGRLRMVVDPLGRRTSYEVHENGHLAAVLFPDGSRLTRSHDEKAALITWTMRDGRKVLHEVDFKRGTLQEIVWPDRSRTELDYDHSGKVTAIRNASGAISYNFSSAGNVLSEQTPLGTFRYERDAEDRLLRLITPRGWDIQYEYDADGRVCRVRDWNGVQAHVSYSPEGSIAQIAYGDYLVEKHVYARAGRLEHASVVDQSGRALSEQRYTYDTSERLTEATDMWGDAPNHRLARRFLYDRESRVLSEVDLATSQVLARFAYDAKGNLIDDNGVPLAVGVMDDPLSYGQSPIVHDANGNILLLPGPKGPITCTYNADGTLRAVRAGARDLHFQYDAIGRRTLKTDGRTTWRYGWSGKQLLWEEREDGPGELTIRRDYIYFPDSITPFAFRENERTYFLQSDARGAVIRTFDTAGKVVWQASYDSFGAARLSVSEIRQPFRLMGHYEDDETGLYYNLARYYSPFIKSYLSIDPSWARPGATNYSYARNDPWNLADPLGTWAQFLVAAGAIALGAAVGAVRELVTGGDPLAGALDGAFTTAGGLLGGWLGGPVGATAGRMIGRAASVFVRSVIAQLRNGEPICWSCALTSSGVSLATDALLNLVGLGFLGPDLGLKVLRKLLVAVTDPFLRIESQKQYDGYFVGRGCKGYNGQMPPDGGIRPQSCHSGGIPLPKVYYLNGINTTFADENANPNLVHSNTEPAQGRSNDGVCKQMQEVADNNCVEVIGIYNATEGFVRDLDESVSNIERAGKTPAAGVLSDLLMSNLGQPITLFVHSQGGLITQEALLDVKHQLMAQGLTEAEASSALSNITVNSFGTAAKGWPHGPSYTHVTNTADPVPDIMAATQSLFPSETFADSANNPVHLFNNGEKGIGAHGLDRYMYEWHNMLGNPACNCS